MFDNLRDMTDRPESKAEPASFPMEEYRESTPRSGRFMGMTAGQRLLISILLFGRGRSGVTCLLVTERATRLIDRNPRTAARRPSTPGRMPSQDPFESSNLTHCPP
jgi:hypothetical protein